MAQVESSPGPAEVLEDPAAAGFGSRLRSLATGSGIFFLGEGVGRGLSVLMVPLYTRAMTPEDYGVLAVTATLTIVITLALSLSLDAAIMRLSFEYEPAEVRRLYGTLLLSMGGFATVVAVALDRIGMAGGLDFFDAAPFDPYLRLALWSAYGAVFMVLPVAVYTMREEAKKAVAITLSYTVLQVVMTIVFVVILDQGAIGALRGALVAGTAVGAASIVLMVRMSTLRISRRFLVASLLLSLPLIPHSLTQWVLHMSDRLLIEPYVSQSDLGLYSLAYSVGALALLFVFAFSKAVGPVMIRQLKDEGMAGDVPRMGTYSLAALTVLCLGIALFGAPLLRVATPSEYHGAIELVPWIAFGHLAVAIYTIVSQGAWFAMKTGWIAVGTIIAGALNVAFNLILVPPYGVTAAAIATFLGFASLALIQGLLAHRFHPIPWEYGRWAKLLAAAGAAFAAGWAAGTEQVLPDLAIKTLAVLIVFPVALALFRFATDAERAWLRTQAGALGARLRRA